MTSMGVISPSPPLTLHHQTAQHAPRDDRVVLDANKCAKNERTAQRRALGQTREALAKFLTKAARSFVEGLAHLELRRQGGRQALQRTEVHATNIILAGKPQGRRWR